MVEIAMKPSCSANNAENPSMSRGVLRVMMMMTMMIMWASDRLSSRSSAGVLALVPITESKHDLSLNWGLNSSTPAAYAKGESFLPTNPVTNDFAWPTAASLRNVGIYARGQNTNEGGDLVDAGQPSGDIEREAIWARADAAAESAEGVMPFEKEFMLFFSVMASESGRASHDTIARVAYASNSKPLRTFPRYAGYSMAWI